MAKNFSDKNLVAVIKSIMITKQDAELDVDNPPRDILSISRLFMLRNAFLQCDLQAVLNKLLAIESNRKVLRNELNTLFQVLLVMFDSRVVDPVSICSVYSLSLLRKYDFEIVPTVRCIMNITSMYFTFPDIVYNLLKKYPQLKTNWDKLPEDYTNFKREYKNPGLIGLVPKNTKYGGFVKALIHLTLRSSGTVDFCEHTLATCRCIYNSSLTPFEKREEWFEKLKIKESDCLLWSQIFNQHFPEHTDVHKYFGQIA